MLYDPFQKKAIDFIEQGHSVLVSAPTGAGKTAIAEYAIVKSLKEGQRVVYTAPIKALSNQKYRDFSARYPDQVGLLTGDVSINPDAPLVIMTTEIYRNRLFEAPERLKNTSWVIFDEVHYLDDPQRGTVWEEAIMFSPEHMRFVALSATAPNIQELADWMKNSLEAPIEVIIETHRPVPLSHLFQCQGVIYSDPHALKKQGYMDQEIWPQARGGSGSHRQGRHRFYHRSFQRSLRAKPNRTDDLIRHLMSEKKLPCLYFAFGRKRAEELAWEHKNYDFLSPNEKDEVAFLYKELSERFDLSHESSAIEMRQLVEHGIAYHHAGMLPTLKEVIERLFTSKLIKLIFTTETFALGINMPAKTVVFDELRKFYGTHFDTLRTRDYFQMAGRAGRRGIDTTGFVYSRINPHYLPYPALMRAVFGRPEPIESQFNSCYATLLNLYAQLGPRLIQMYPKSFHHFQSNHKGREKGVAAIERKLGLLKGLGYLGETGLTPKGEFASWMYGYELLLSEMLEDGTLDTLGSAKLSILLSALVFEPRKNQILRELGPELSGLEKKSLHYLKRIHSAERAHKVYPPTRPPYFHLTHAMQAWIGGAAFHELKKWTDVDEGEIIRYFRMVIQLLRQLKQAPQVTPRLREIAGHAVKAINRDLVDAEKQLRNS